MLVHVCFIDWLKIHFSLNVLTRTELRKTWKRLIDFSNSNKLNKILFLFHTVLTVSTQNTLFLYKYFIDKFLNVYHKYFNFRKSLKFNFCNKMYSLLFLFKIIRFHLAYGDELKTLKVLGIFSF